MDLTGFPVVVNLAAVSYHGCYGIYTMVNLSVTVNKYYFSNETYCDDMCMPM